jgi:hypothetical protein
MEITSVLIAFHLERNGEGGGMLMQGSASVSSVISAHLSERGFFFQDTSNDA